MAVNQLKAGALLNYVVLGLNALVGIVYTPYMLRMMGQSEYGIYSLAASVIAYLSILDLGFGNAVIRYTAKFRAEGKVEEQYSMFGMFTILYSIIGILAFFAGLILYFNVDAMFGSTLTATELERTRVIILLMVFNLAVTFPLSIYGAIITAYEDFIFLRVVQIARIIMNTAVMVCLLAMGYRAIAMVVVQTIFNLITLGLNYVYCRKKIKIKVKYTSFQWDFLKEVSIYSFWIFLNVITDKVYWSMGQIVLGFYEGTRGIAIFSLAIQLCSMFMLFSTAISGVFLPRITNMLINKKSNEDVTTLFIKTGRLQFIILSYILLIVVIFGQDFIRLWAGDDYIDSYKIVVILFISLMIPLIQNIGTVVLQAMNKMLFKSVSFLLVGIIVCILIFPVSRVYGYYGCSVCIALGIILSNFFMNWYYNEKIKIDIKKFWCEILKISLMPILIYLMSFLFKVDSQNIMELILNIMLFSIVCLFIYYKFICNESERNYLKLWK